MPCIEVVFHNNELERLRSWLSAHGKIIGVPCRKLYHPYYSIGLEKSDYEEYCAWSKGSKWLN